MRLAEALKKIEKVYGTLDVNQVFLAASSHRVGSGHEETSISRCSGIYCPSCGVVEELCGDPEFHPEQYVEVKTVACSLCHELCEASKAHRHQDGWVGDECCWDERLKCTE